MRALLLLLAALPALSASAAPPTGTVEIISDPPGLTIWVDQVDTGRRSPGYVQIPADRVAEITVRSDTSSRSRSVSLAPGEVLRLRFSLAGGAAPIGAVRSSGETPTVQATGQDEYEIPPEIDPGETEWFFLHPLIGGNSAGVQAGLDIGFFTLRWPGVYWNIVHGGASSVAGFSYYVGSSAGYVLSSANGRHDLRIGGLIGYGRTSQWFVAPAGFEFDGGDSDKLDHHADGAVIMPQISYVGHIARWFSLEVGVAVLIPFASAESTVDMCQRKSEFSDCIKTPASNEEQDRLVPSLAPTPINIYGFFGFRI